MTDGTLIGWMLKTITERIHEELPAGRERSLALTKLEEADMWLGCAIGSMGIIRPTTTDTEEG